MKCDGHVLLYLFPTNITPRLVHDFCAISHPTQHVLPQNSKVERAYVRYKTVKQGWREIVGYEREKQAATRIQRWTRGVLVRRRVPLVGDAEQVLS